MLKPAGIPTGAYQLMRVATPLDPDPKGPVYDGGMLVCEGKPPEVGAPAIASPTASPDSQDNEVSSAEGLRNKYLFMDVRRELVAILTLPERHSRGDVLIDCNKVSFAMGKTTPLSQETLSRLMEDERFRKPVLSPTDIRVCGMVPGSAGLKGLNLMRLLAQRRVQLPAIEDLTAACAIHYATTGRHLIPLGRTIQASNGAIRTSRWGGRLNVVLGDADPLANDAMVAAAGTIPPGEQSLTAHRRGNLLRRLVQLTGLSVE
jgi:hypothetical protein